MYDMTNQNISLPKKLKERVEREAEKNLLTVSAFVRLALLEYLKKEKEGRKEEREEEG